MCNYRKLITVMVLTLGLSGTALADNAFTISVKNWSPSWTLENAGTVYELSGQAPGFSAQYRMNNLYFGTSMASGSLTGSGQDISRLDIDYFVGVRMPNSPTSYYIGLKQIGYSSTTSSYYNNLTYIGFAMGLNTAMRLSGKLALYGGGSLLLLTENYAGAYNDDYTGYTYEVGIAYPVAGINVTLAYKGSAAVSNNVTGYSDNFRGIVLGASYSFGRSSSSSPRTS